MTASLWRRWIGGGISALVGGAGAVYVAVTSGFDAVMASVLFGLVSIGGLFVILGRVKDYYSLLPFVGILALISSLGYYLNTGVTAPTLALAVLAVVSLGRSFQAYRART